MANLVCEGTCNPNLAVLDAELKKAERSDAGIYTDAATGKATVLFVSLLSPETVAKVRALVHTDHRQGSTGKVECQVCHTERRF